MTELKAIDANALIEWLESHITPGGAIPLEDVIAAIRNAPTCAAGRSIGLQHIVAVDYTSKLGGKTLMERTFLYNNTQITQDQALEVLRSGRTSPYVIDMSRNEFVGVFKERGEIEASDVKGQSPAPNTIRAKIHPGALVDIVLKADQPTGKLTRGRVRDILTNSPQHHRGIKVRLTDGQVGRVQAIIEEAKACGSS